MEPSELYSETWKLDGELGQPQYDQDKCQLSGTVKEPVFWVPVVRNEDRGRRRREGLAVAAPALPGAARPADQGRGRLLRLSQVAARALLDTQHSGRNRVRRRDPAGSAHQP